MEKQAFDVNSNCQHSGDYRRDLSKIFTLGEDQLSLHQTPTLPDLAVQVSRVRPSCRLIFTHPESTSPCVGPQEYFKAAASAIGQATNNQSGIESITGIWVSSDDATVLPEARKKATNFFPNVRPDNVVSISFRTVESKAEKIPTRTRGMVRMRSRPRRWLTAGRFSLSRFSSVVVGFRRWQRSFGAVYTWRLGSGRSVWLVCVQRTSRQRLPSGFTGKTGQSGFLPRCLFVTHPAFCSHVFQWEGHDTQRRMKCQPSILAATRPKVFERPFVARSVAGWISHQRSRHLLGGRRVSERFERTSLIIAN